jgi:SAM-dependent methyltransferase
MSLISRVHGGFVYGRRVRVLSEILSRLIPRSAEILDVGCGDGVIDSLIMASRQDLRIQGIDVLIRPNTCIPVREFDGSHIPHEDAAFDLVMFVDVLHHTEDPMVLMREATRVARSAILIKDHDSLGWLAPPTLRLMDWVGNARHGVSLTYNYWPKPRWLDAFRSLCLSVQVWEQKLGLYPWWGDVVFGRSLHFVSLLSKPAEGHPGGLDESRPSLSVPGLNTHHTDAR